MAKDVLEPPRQLHQWGISDHVQDAEVDDESGNEPGGAPTDSAFDFELIVITDERQKFTKLADEWKRTTAGYPTIRQKIGHDAYRGIVAMGDSAVPLILEDLERRPNHWFWALSAITGEDPIPDKDKGDITKMAEAWIAWGKERKML